MTQEELRTNVDGLLHEVRFYRRWFCKTLKKKMTFDDLLNIFETFLTSTLNKLDGKTEQGVE